MEELVKKAQNGDSEAFTNLMLLFENDLYKIAKARLKNDDDVCDVMQETMLISFKTIKKLKNPFCFKPWIIKILISKSNDMYRKKSKSNVIPLEEVNNYKNMKNADMESTESTLDFNFICKNLKYEDRIIIMLYYMEQFTDKEIGKILNLKENTVKTKRTRCIQEIKKIIKREENTYG